MIQRRKKSTGLVIHSGILYALQLKIDKSGPVVKNFSKLTLEEGVMDEDCIVLDPDAFKSAVRQVLSNGARGSINDKKISLSVPEEKVFSHKVSVPKDRQDDIDFIKTLANDFIPIELDSAVFDAQVVGFDHETGKVHLECVAVQQSIVTPLMEILGEIDLEVIQIDIDTNALVRAFHNTFNKNEDDFILIHTGQKHDLLSIVSSKGNIYKHLLKLGPEVKRGTARYANELQLKLTQLIGTISAQEQVRVKRAYLVGDVADFPAFQSILLGIFPEVQLDSNVDFMKCPDGMESEFLQCVGLCLRGFERGNLNRFNLLTEQKKEELTDTKLATKGKLYLFMIASVLAVILVWMGINTARNYFDYQLTNREIVILNEQINDPYVAQIAEINKQSNQKELQIKNIFQEILPLGPFIRQLDSYNHAQGIGLLSLSYAGKNSDNEIQIQLRARADSREETENFVKLLEENDLFVEVNSPLSNLVSKGERVINISLTLDQQKIRLLNLDSVLPVPTAPDSPESSGPRLPSVP